jgi:hypothetical protein
VAQAAGTSPTWSPDSRLLAYATASGIAVLDVQTGGTRLLTSDEGSLLRWSPDGTMLAYVDCCDLRTVTPTGSVRTVAPGADADFVADLEWTRAAPGLAYRPAAASVSLADVYTTFPVKLLAADGDRVAYASCGGFYLWTPDDGSAASGGSVLTLLPHVTPVVPAQSPADACVTRVYEDPYALALAGDRLAYTTVAGANNQLWAVRTVEFGQSPQLLTSGGAGPCCTSYPVVAAHGSLAVYAYRTGADDIWTVRVPGGQPLLSFRQSRFAQVALHVDGDRVLVARAGAVDVVLSENGGTVFHLDVPGNPSPPPNQQKPPDAQLDGPFVAVRDGGVVDVYAVDGGALVHTWPLPDGSTLQDAAHGLLAVSANGEIDVLRLTDGLRTRVAAGTLAAFLRNGLAIANGAHVSIAPNSLLPSTR